MNYVGAAIYTLDGAFRGYAIIRNDQRKLQSTNVWAEGEEQLLNEQLARLNTDVNLRDHWPNPKDPEVLALLADETFMPIEYKMAEMVDDENSFYVWEQVQEVDPERGLPTGRTVDGERLDEEASVIAFKMAKVPVAPAHEHLRIKKACEVVARQRAGIPV